METIYRIRMAFADDHLAGYWPIIYRWRRPVLGVTAAACALSLAVSLLLPNIYRATAIFYPTNLPELATAVNPTLILEGEKLTLSTDADDSDRLISLGQSHALAQTIIRQYQLTQRYSYAPTDTAEATRQKVLDIFRDKYTIALNDRSALEVSFEDADKHFAARVANALVQQIDSLNQHLTRANQRQITAAYAQRLRYLEKELAAAQQHLLRARRQYGIFGSTTAERADRPESRYLAERLIQTETDLRQAQATLAGLRATLPATHPRIIELQAQLKGLEVALRALQSGDGNRINRESYLAGTDEVSKREAIFQSRQAEYLKALQAHADAELALTTKISSVYLVQPAYPPTQKAKPIRWLIVAGATLFAFLLAVLAVSILERLPRARRHFYA